MDRYCIKCGKITTKKNDNLFICEAGHDNWVNPDSSAVIYVIKDGSVLFGVRSIEPNKGKLSLPGGFINVGETAEQAAIREVKEELGIDVVLRSFLGTYSTSYGARSVLNIVFIAEGKDQAIIPGDDMQGGEPQWYEIVNLPTASELAWDWYQAAQQDLLAWWRQNPQS